MSAVIVEDKVFPKRNSFGGTVSSGMENPEIFAQKLKVGVDTKSTEKSETKNAYIKVRKENKVVENTNTEIFGIII